MHIVKFEKYEDINLSYSFTFMQISDIYSWKTYQ